MFITTRLTALLAIGLLFVLQALAPVETAEPAPAALRAAIADSE